MQTVTDCTETREQWQCSAKHEGATTAHLKNDREKIFCALRGRQIGTSRLCSLHSPLNPPFQISRSATGMWVSVWEQGDRGACAGMGYECECGSRGTGVCVWGEEKSVCEWGGENGCECECVGWDRGACEECVCVRGGGGGGGSVWGKVINSRDIWGPAAHSPLGFLLSSHHVQHLHVFAAVSGTTLPIELDYRLLRIAHFTHPFVRLLHLFSLSAVCVCV